MTERINKLYKPDELKAALEALQNGPYVTGLNEVQAIGIIKQLYELGFRIVKVDQEK